MKPHGTTNLLETWVTLPHRVASGVFTFTETVYLKTSMTDCFGFAELRETGGRKRVVRSFTLQLYLRKAFSSRKTEQRQYNIIEDLRGEDTCVHICFLGITTETEREFIKTIARLPNSTKQPRTQVMRMRWYISEYVLETDAELRRMFDELPSYFEMPLNWTTKMGNFIWVFAFVAEKV